MLREERKLFPLAMAVLTEKEWQVIDAAVNAIDDPLFDEMTADDYQRLYRLITEQSELGRWPVNLGPSCL